MTIYYNDKRALEFPTGFMLPKPKKSDGLVLADVDNVIGFYKPLKGRTHFFTLEGELFAALIDNTHNEQFFVNAGTIKGRTFYMNATSALTEEALGMNGLSYKDCLEMAEAMAAQIRSMGGK